ncbi:DNA cytosine methyltransferase [Yinghuangia sp. ASG 101]|uniref:DNA cytosine methyltransferase n=1 Tax=Yinghuangia sp. ASG 101 TaxID=2896848 RepID=UPI001E62C8F4|nr:DNA cytosine methyltransferase [Yinghuangia sp. ASG 101]UGQ13489.1 DNA cytosine methyltransferase [Yinghuangia sp. ASG 101]
MTRFTSLELCAGSGAQALGLERAGFDPVMLIDNNEFACRTIGLNRPQWDVRCRDLMNFDPLDEDEPDLRKVLDIDLISGGMPRIKAAAAVARRGGDDHERALLKAAVSVLMAVRPKALMLENLEGFVLSDDCAEDRSWIDAELENLGYRPFWNVLDAADFGVPQYRRSGFVVALADAYRHGFVWPVPSSDPPPTVGQALGLSMGANGWPGAERWAVAADRPAPALIGGSDNRGGGDLGPTGSKRVWATIGVEGASLSDASPAADFPIDGRPRLSVRQAATLQAIPETWQIFGPKTRAYRQIANAMPPPVAEAVGRSIATALCDGAPSTI